VAADEIIGDSLPASRRLLEAVLHDAPAPALEAAA
jgi:hypothetical protein